MQASTGMTEAQIQQLIKQRERTPIRVPVTALYSKTDGVVSWPAAIDDTNPDVEHVEVLEFARRPRRQCAGLQNRRRAPESTAEAARLTSSMLRLCAWADCAIWSVSSSAAAKSSPPTTTPASRTIRGETILSSAAWGKVTWRGGVRWTNGSSDPTSTILNANARVFMLDIMKDLAAPMNSLVGNPEAVPAARGALGRSRAGTPCARLEQSSGDLSGAGTLRYRELKRAFAQGSI
jgi:hypothetical protein